MLAARLNAPGEELRLEEIPVPEPQGTEVRVRVAGCGVCRTDLHVVDGTQLRVELPRTLGHEVSGYIDKLGPEARLQRRARLSVGDAVVVSGGWGCGECIECASGAEQRCEQSMAPGFQRDGGYAEAMIVPHPRHLVGIGKLDPLRAAPLADAGVTPYRAVRRAGPWLEGGGARVLLIGCGALGQFALQYLRMLRGGRDLHVVVREVDPTKLEIAATLGADVGLLEGDVQMTREALAGPADVVLDMVGTDETLAHAAASVAQNGVILLIGEAGGRISLGIGEPALESWFTTVAWGSREDLRAVVQLASRRRLRWEVEPIPLREVAVAHERLRAGDVPGRLVLVP